MSAVRIGTREILGVAVLVALLHIPWSHAKVQDVHDPAIDGIQAEVDEIFKEYDNPSTPGAAVAIMRDGTVVLSKGYGMAHLEYHIPITPETVFDIASMSKAFTALAITMLEKQGGAFDR